MELKFEPYNRMKFAENARNEFIEKLYSGAVVMYRGKRFVVTNVERRMEPVEITALGGQRMYMPGMEQIFVTIQDVEHAHMRWQGMGVEPLTAVVPLEELMYEDYVRPYEGVKRVEEPEPEPVEFAEELFEL